MNPTLRFAYAALLSAPLWAASYCPIRLDDPKARRGFEKLDLVAGLRRA